MQKILTKCVAFLLASVLLAGCSATRFFDENETLLSDVKLKSTDKHVKPSTYRQYVNQEPNSRWFNFLRVPLGLYCISGTDSTKRVNKFFRRIGQAPVIYDHSLTTRSKDGLTTALKSRGYLHAVVTADTTTRKRRTKVTYTMDPGKRYNVQSINSYADDEKMDSILKKMLFHSGKAKGSQPQRSTRLQKGMWLDESVLSEERLRIIGVLQDSGYYNINNEFITFRADTAAGVTGVELSLLMMRPAGVDSAKCYATYKVRKVRLRENVPSAQADSSLYKGLLLVYDKKPSLFRRVYEAHVDVKPGNLVREKSTQNTYVNLNGLPIVNYSTLRYTEVPGDEPLLDCDINVMLNKKHAISAELEGTNTAGNLGAALALTYTNRNIFRGAELFSLKGRGAYEAITGLDGYQNSNYIE